MNTYDMDFVSHLEELRKRLIIVLGTFTFLFIVSMVYVQSIYQWVIKGLSIKLAVLGPTEIIWVYLILACVIAIAGTIPIAAHQTWLFVRPALNEKEQRTTLAYIPALFILFIGGISFGYFFIFPVVFQFLLTLTDGMVMPFFTTEKYFRFLLHLVLPFGFLFELPAVIMFLTSLGLVNPHQLKKMRKYAYFILIVTAILITPPDILSDVLVIVPLLFLYEGSILLSKVVFRKKERMDLALRGT